MGDTAMNVPVEVRSHELAQLHDMVPAAESELRDVATDENSLGEEADTLGRVYDEHINGVEQKFDAGDESFAAYVSMPADDWRAVIRHLPRLYEDEGTNRVQWLQKKLVNRLRDRLDEMDDE